MRRSCIAIVCVGLAWAVPGNARADRVYTLQHVGSELATGAPVYGIATLPDGSIVYADLARRRLTRLLTDGRRVPFAPDVAFKGYPSNLLVQADGSILVVDSHPSDDSFTNAVVRRIAPDGSANVVAGRETHGGDFQEGAPATSVYFGSDYLYLADRPDGGFLISGANGRVLRVRPDGTMETAAGGGQGPAFDAEGGEAVGASLPGPRDIASTPDGGFVVLSDTRVLRVTPDGTIHTIAGGNRIANRCRSGRAVATDFAFPTALETLPDGSVAVADGELGCLFRISTAGTASVLAGRGPSQPVYIRGDFRLSRSGFFFGDGARADRAFLRGLSDIVRDPFGRLVFLDGVRVGMLAPRGAERVGVAIRGSARAPNRLRYVSTAGGAASLSAVRGGKTLAITHARARRGTNVIGVPAASPGLGRLVLRVRTADGATDLDELGVVLGARLPVPVARHVMTDGLPYGDGGPDYYVDRCKRVGRRRVDCLIRGAYTRRCRYVLALRLTTIGLPKESGYACGTPPPFRPHHKPTKSETVPLA